MKLYNTLTRNKETFKPQVMGQVDIYTCGPTVYDYMHLGNWVSYIRWDILIRTLIASGNSINRVLNITDVGHLVSDADTGEDKLEKGAKREGKTAWEVAKKYTQDFEFGFKSLNLVPPTHMPKATEHIPDQIELIRRLEDKGYTYAISDGVYFNTAMFPNYAKFAGLNLAGQQSGARVEENYEKRNPQDFALWKLTPPSHERHMEWDSPWGKGFPGWHIECSAMAIKYLGETLDIHTGGIDHIPVHHTNEIAQSEAATNKIFSKFWLHNNFLLVDGVKISKSLGNTITLDDILAKGFDPIVFKFFVLQSHYRSESNFTWANLTAAKDRLQKLRAFSDLRWQASDSPNDISIDFSHLLHEVLLALQDDLNTPLALSVLSGLSDITVINKTNVPGFNNFLKSIDELLGLNLASGLDISIELKKIITEREIARANNDFDKADSLRAQLTDQGLEINDTPSGPIWSRSNSN